MKVFILSVLFLAGVCVGALGKVSLMDKQDSSSIKIEPLQFVSPGGGYFRQRGGGSCG